MFTLFSTEFGSRLYGTQTPTSDIDLKHIVMPYINDLILGKKLVNVVKKTNKIKNVRNSADDIDEEFIPLQIFARDFFNGQTYAIELAFAINGDHSNQKIFDLDGEVIKFPNGGQFVEVKEAFSGEVEYRTPFIISFIEELKQGFLTSNIKAMMGYVVNQASLYSFKGERLNAVKELIQLFEKIKTKHSDSFLTINDVAYVYESDFINLNLKYPKYFRNELYDVGSGQMKRCFSILEKKLPFTNTIDTSLNVLDSLNNKYGSRANDASKTNVDWKATMHALRIVDEGISILKFHTIKFPLPKEYVDKLLSIRRGEINIELITEELSSKLDELKDLVLSTSLPTNDEKLSEEFETWLTYKLKDFYRV